jgi:hypothetical protein
MAAQVPVVGDLDHNPASSRIADKDSKGTLTRPSVFAEATTDKPDTLSHRMGGVRACWVAALPRRVSFS